mgnify:CR=1 FL=1
MSAKAMRKGALNVTIFSLPYAGQVAQFGALIRALTMEGHAVRFATSASCLDHVQFYLGHPGTVTWAALPDNLTRVSLMNSLSQNTTARMADLVRHGVAQQARS